MPKLASLSAEVMRIGMQSLEEEYNAAFDQLQSTLSAVDRTRLERQIQTIESTLTEVVQQLDALEAT